MSAVPHREPRALCRAVSGEGGHAVVGQGGGQALGMGDVPERTLQVRGSPWSSRGQFKHPNQE